MRPPRHQGPSWAPRHLLFTRGIHRTVVAFLLVAMLVGALAGALLHAGFVTHHSAGFLCLAVSVLFALWPLSWLAAARIAWPLRDLARLAGELRGGRLSSREGLPAGPGEVGEVGDALRGMADRVARQLRDQRALMAAVSHELRSPLGRARVLIELAREGTAGPGVHDELQAEIDAMDQLVGDLLAAARIDFEAVNPLPLDAADLARRALEVAGLPAESLVMDAEPGEVRVDPTLVTRALAALLDNARRYGASTVQLTVRGRARRVRFEVGDDGPGFPPGSLEQAFQPFWRGGSAENTRRPRGEGLGLALVRQIAEAHRGEVGAENRTEGGARVWMELPRDGNTPG